MVSSADIFNARILVVDDKEANVRLLEGMLRVAGARFDLRLGRHRGSVCLVGATRIREECVGIDRQAYAIAGCGRTRCDHVPLAVFSPGHQHRWRRPSGQLGR